MLCNGWAFFDRHSARTTTCMGRPIYTNLFRALGMFRRGAAPKWRNKLIDVYISLYVY
jgi:hypothetical protein